MIGKQKLLTVTFSDEGRGLRHTDIVITQDNRSNVVASNDYPEAANSGIVRFTGPLGIYGNTIIVDHGLGVATLYAHMSAIQVRPDQTVNRGEIIGSSGATGLAGGDHLHFGLAIHGRFVDPREWWDPHWIADNVTTKTAVAF